MTGRVAGRSAAVVGAGQTPGETLGNGRAIALRLAQEGARVLCVDSQLERARDTAAMIAAEGGEALAFEADITDPAACQALVGVAVRAFGDLSILVNNVGIGGGDAPAHRLEEEVFDRILNVNLKASWLTIREAIPVMRKAGGGAIVNVSSLAALAGANQLAYEVSKAGVNRLTTSVAQANARYGVRCNAVLPGYIDTPMAVSGIAAASNRTVAEVRAARNAQVPLRGRMGTAFDTANAVLFLASSEADFITGALLPVDGGMGVRIG